jgi:hypothetical protein
MNEELNSVWKQLNECHALEGEEARDLLRPICTALQELGVSSVELSYSGYGDEGYIESSSFFPEAVDVPNVLREIVVSWSEAVLPPGWENDEGGQGTVLVNVADATARIEHEMNVIATESKTYEIGDKDE